MASQEDRNLPVPLGRLVASCTFYVSRWLDEDQVRVSEVSPTEFRVKCGKMLTDQEVKGAIVKYLLSKQPRGTNPMSLRDPLPFLEMCDGDQALKRKAAALGFLDDAEEREILARDDDEYIETDEEDGPDPDEDDEDEDAADEIFGFGDGEDEGMQDDEPDEDQDYDDLDEDDQPTPEDLDDAEDLEGLDD